jgi:hypothetical protein
MIDTTTDSTPFLGPILLATIKGLNSRSTAQWLGTFGTFGSLGVPNTTSLQRRVPPTRDSNHDDPVSVRHGPAWSPFTEIRDGQRAEK